MPHLMNIFYHVHPVRNGRTGGRWGGGKLAGICIVIALIPLFKIMSLILLTTSHSFITPTLHVTTLGLKSLNNTFKVTELMR